MVAQSVADPQRPILGVSVLVVALTFGVLVAVGVWRPGPRKLTPRQQRRNEVLGSAIVATAFLGLLLLTPKVTGIVSDMTGIPDIHGAKGLAALASIVIAVLFAFGNLRTPAYAFFWMFGIVAIDWAATDAVPAINGWLDRVSLPTP